MELPPGTEYGVEERFGIGSDGDADVVYWFTVSLAAGNETASIAAIAIGALRGGKRIERSAHALRIVVIELRPRGSLQGFAL